MATIKSYSDLQQSKKLAEILPLESADMGWNVFVDETTRILPIDDWDLVKDGSGNVKFYHAWSLAALLGVIKDKVIFGGNSPEGWFCCYTIQNPTKTLTIYGKSLVDACVAMVEKLNELKLL